MRHYELPRCTRVILTVAFLALCLCFSGPARAAECMPLDEHVAGVKTHQNYLDSRMLTPAEFKTTIAFVQTLGASETDYDVGYLVLRSDMYMILFAGKDGKICGTLVLNPPAAEMLLDVLKRAAGQGV